MTKTWDSAMKLALAEANQAGEDVPVGAVLVDPEGNLFQELYLEHLTNGLGEQDPDMTWCAIPGSVRRLKSSQV
jgi:hypothetical protein